MICTGRTRVSEDIATAAVRRVYLELSGLSVGPVDDGELAVAEHGLERVTLPVPVGDMSLQHPLVAQILLTLFINTTTSYSGSRNDKLLVFM